tara:strand:- start:445 stop:1239 length:795 start_codon:yes stop_codon:yes gene_type:complete
MYKVLIGKMKVVNSNPVEYYFLINNSWMSVNNFIGKKISFIWSGDVFCSCGKKMKKFYRQNFCYECFWNSPEASPSIFKPELCQAHLGIEERDLEWEKKFQLQPHVVYLSISSGVKVGVTRKNSIETRWIDQGAIEGIVLAETPNRYLAGKIEVSLKEHLPDKTSWMKMLKGEVNKVDLIKKKQEVINLIIDDFQPYVVDGNNLKKITFPIQSYPQKIKSISLEKQNILEEKLVGIKGQYLIFDSNHVFNVRRHTGFFVDLAII